MRTKEELYKELRHIDLTNELSEPVVTSSILSCKSSVYKCCISFYVHDIIDNKERKRITITLDAHSKKRADMEGLEVQQNCQQSIHDNFLSLSKHNLIEHIDKWLDILEKEKRIKQNTIETRRNKLKILKRYDKFAHINIEDVTITDINKFFDWAIINGSSTGGPLANSTIVTLHTLLFNFF